MSKPTDIQWVNVQKSFRVEQVEKMFDQMIQEFNESNNIVSINYFHGVFDTLAIFGVDEKEISRLKNKYNVE
jgi:hypothetical protein